MQVGTSFRSDKLAPHEEIIRKSNVSRLLLSDGSFGSTQSPTSNENTTVNLTAQQANNHYYPKVIVNSPKASAHNDSEIRRSVKSSNVNRRPLASSVAISKGKALQVIKKSEITGMINNKTQR